MLNYASKIQRHTTFNLALDYQSNLGRYTRMIVDKKTIRLRDLAAGKVAKVVSISGEPREISRIASLGLRTGEVISVTRGGITCIIQFCNGTRLCLRMSSTLEIFVQEI